MKQQDIAILIVALAVGGIVSFFISQSIFLSSSSKRQSAQKVEQINPEFTRPDNSVFNGQAINPTKLIEIGDQSNSTPF